MTSGEGRWESDAVTRAVDSLSLPLEPLPLAEGTVVAGSPAAGIATPTGPGEAGLGEGLGVEVGVWELSEGVVTDTEVDEVFVVVAGAGSVTFGGGETIDLRPGVVVRLREGERTTWTVTETLRKVWIAR